MLESYSTGTFISEELFSQLGRQGTDTQVMIRTMNGPRLHESTLVTGLVVSDLNGGKPIELPKTFVRDKIPGSEQIPHPKSFHKWTHLRRVIDQLTPPIQNTKAGLLVGTNCPEAVEPKDFVASQSGGPFAVLTFAGWTVVGLLCMSNNAPEIDCNRIIVRKN